MALKLRKIPRVDALKKVDFIGPALQKKRTV